jgi:hypothetical protein
MPASKAEQVLDSLKALLGTDPDVVVEPTAYCPRRSRTAA